MRYLSIVLVLLFIVLQYKLWFSSQGVKKTVDLKHMLELQKDLNAKVEQRNAMLATSVKALKDNPVVIERKARKELGMIHNDEIFYQITDVGSKQ